MSDCTEKERYGSLYSEIRIESLQFYACPVTGLPSFQEQGNFYHKKNGVVKWRGFLENSLKMSLTKKKSVSYLWETGETWEVRLCATGRTQGIDLLEIVPQPGLQILGPRHTQVQSPTSWCSGSWGFSSLFSTLDKVHHLVTNSLP